MGSRDPRGRSLRCGEDDETIRRGERTFSNRLMEMISAAAGARDERPRRRRAADERYELAPPHSITSSARASTVAGTSRPRALAVLRLITSSYLVGACTGRSAGF